MLAAEASYPSKLYNTIKTQSMQQFLATLLLTATPNHKSLKVLQPLKETDAVMFVMVSRHVHTSQTAASAASRSIKPIKMSRQVKTLCQPCGPLISTLATAGAAAAPVGSETGTGG